MATVNITEAAKQATPATDGMIKSFGADISHDADQLEADDHLDQQASCCR